MSGASDAESGQPGQSGESEVTPRATESGEYEASSWPRWSDEDWRRWNESWWGWGDGAASPHSADFQEPYEYNSSGTHACGWVGGQSTSQNSSTASRGVDPWQGGSDPWSGHQGGGSHYETRTGGNDKIVVPEFNGEDDREGGKTRGYLRKVEAWRRVTRLPPQKQALILYNSLGGKAWRDAEELDVSHLDAVDGVDKFIGWITERYLDKEVIKAGRYMSDFFKVFKKTHDQDIRDFNMEFDRHLTKLKEIGCLLPGLCSSWWYVDKLRLDNSAELNLLASVGNQYDLRRLQEAAIVQDRMNRRIWENNNKRTNGKGDFKKNQQAFCTELDDAPDDEEDQDDLYDFSEPEIEEGDDETHEAFVAFQNAKAKYRDALKARGTVGANSREEALQKAKARSCCSACGKKGHWHRDPECPRHKEKNMAGPHTTHVVFYTEGETLDVIADCACSRTLAGSRWIKDYIYALKEHDIPYFVIDQDEVFKFGGPRLYPSKKAPVGWLRINRKWFAIKISIVAVNVPLLLSRPALAALGTNYRMEDNMADFTNLGLDNVQLKFTSTGHPKVDAVSFDGSLAPSWPERVGWGVTELHIPTGSETADALGAYMADRLSGVLPKLFYPKLSPSAEEFLCRDPFPHELFLNWWKQNEITKDFWIETTDCMIRIHVTPRRTPFDPRRWQTSNDTLKKQLMSRLGEVRTSTFVPCYNHTMPIEVQHEWQCDPGQRPEFLWIGRSRFCRNSTKQDCAPPDRETADASQVCHAVAMADEPGNPDPDLGGEGHHLQAGVDCSRTSCHALGGEPGDGGRQQTNGGPHQDEHRRAEGEVSPRGDFPARQVQQGQPDETSEGESVTDGGGARMLRVLQGLQVQGGPRGLLAAGDGGDGQQSEPLSRLGSSGQVGGTPPNRNFWSRIWEWRPGGQCSDRTTQGASQAEATSGNSDYQQELSDITNTSDSDRGGQQRLLPGGADDGGADLGPGDPSRSLEVHQ